MSSQRSRIQAVLFDLDGTLVDSAPDLAGAANEMLLQRDRPALPYTELRPHAGSGARGMVGRAFGLQPGLPGFEALRIEFLERYEARLLQTTQPFAEVPLLLAALAQQGQRLGIVTNKALRLAAPLVRALGLLPAGAVLVGGDSTPHTKPHPAPLLEAARRLALPPECCVYVGDDHRDMLAGRAAGMPVWAAAWGYLGPGANVHAWDADLVLDSPAGVLKALEVA